MSPSSGVEVSSRQAHGVWRAAGFWLSMVIVVLQALNAVRSFAEPMSFADYMGLPLADPADARALQLYGLRCAFVAVLVALLLARRNLEALKWVALAGLPIPLGDAFLALGAGASQFTVARHVAIAVYIGATYLTLVRWTRREQAASAR